MPSLPTTTPSPREAAAIAAAWEWLRARWEGVGEVPTAAVEGTIRATSEVGEGRTRYLVQLRWPDPERADVNSSFLDVTLGAADSTCTIAYLRAGPSRPQTVLGESAVAHGLLVASLHHPHQKPSAPDAGGLHLVWSGTIPGDQMCVTAGEALALLDFLRQVEPQLRAMYEADEQGFDQSAFRHVYARWWLGGAEGPPE